MFDYQTRILLIDDSAIMQQLLIRSLSDMGYQNTHACNGVKPAQLFLSENKGIQLIICDITMPDLSGLDFLKWVKAHRDLQHIPVVMLTRESEFTTVNQAITLGADGYILKPFNLDSLTEGLDRVHRQLVKVG